MDQEEERLVRDMLDKLPDELREPMEEAARSDGLTLEEYVLRLLRGMEGQGLLEAAASADVTEEEFLRLIFVGDCPRCGSENTDSCDEAEGINDPTVALCGECGCVWCLECGSAVVSGETCGHWDICEACDEEKDELEECGIMPDECPKLLEWCAENYALACQSTCAWCEGEIPEAGEVFAVGATLRGGIEYASNESQTGFFMPVAIGGKLVPAIVTAPDSEAREHGNDLMFMTCSEVCACSLRDALCEQKELIDRAELN